MGVNRAELTSRLDAVHAKVAALAARVGTIQGEDAHPATCDPVGWIEGQLGFKLDGWQADAVRDSANIRKALILAPRQAGKSTVTAAVAAVRLYQSPGLFAICLAPTYRQAKLIFEKLRDVIPHTDIVRETSDTLELANGSKVLALQGSNDRAVRGYSPGLLILDEFAAIAPRTIAAILPSVAAQAAKGEARILCLSTPAGTGNEFHRFWTSGDPGWHKIRVDVSQSSLYTPEILETMRSKLTERMWKQEFLCEFLEQAGALFTADSIEALLSRSDEGKWAGAEPETFERLY